MKNDGRLRSIIDGHIVYQRGHKEDFLCLLSLPLSLAAKPIGLSKRLNEEEEIIFYINNPKL